jgi:AcrR family transcriptional regulator
MPVIAIAPTAPRAGAVEHLAKATLYRHFPSKDDPVVAFLQPREQRWTLDWVEAKARRRGATPEQQLLAIFELFDDWFHRDDFEACSFSNVLLEMGPAHPAGRASIAHLENIRSIVSRLAKEAGLPEPESFARSWHILMKGSIVSAAKKGRRRGAARSSDRAPPDRRTPPRDARRRSATATSD